MPFPTLASLPERVKKFPKKKQEQWRNIWNSVFKQTGEESRAFAAANAKVKESTDMKKNGMRDIGWTQDLSEAMASATMVPDKGIVEGVVLLTGEKVSQNKTFYTKKALNEAKTRYEGAKMYLDHPAPDSGPVRSVRDFGGTYQNLRIEEEKLLRADLHLLPNPQIRDVVMPIVESKPAGVGLSIRDRGRGREEDGVFFVESFAQSKGFSIDLVTEVSVNKNLFESGGDDMKIEDIKLEELQEGNPTLVDKIKSDERQAVLKEMEEKLKKGEDATVMLNQGKKLVALAEAGFPKEVTEKVKLMIGPDSVSVEDAERIIKTQKEIVESIVKHSGANPKVKGHGGDPEDHEEKVEEGKIPEDEELVKSLTE